MAFEVTALSPPLQKANKGQSRAMERLKKKMFDNEFWLLLNSPSIPFRIHSRNGKVWTHHVLTGLGKVASRLILGNWEGDMGMLLAGAPSANAIVYGEWGVAGNM